MRLYHATYKRNLASILENGLFPGGNGKPNWDGISTCEYIYFAFDPEHAISFAETADLALTDDVNHIVLLSVNSEDLDETHIWYDWNVKCNSADEIESLTYDLPIAPVKIQIEADIEKLSSSVHVEFSDLKGIDRRIWEILTDVFEDQVMSDDAV